MVFADEPTGNLDSTAGAEVLGFLRRSVDDLGQSVVMVTHDPTSAGYAHRVLFLADGRLVSELRDPTPEAVLAQLAGIRSGELVVRVALRGVRAHLVRFCLSVLAVALGVAFVAGTFALRTMLGSTFSDIVSTTTLGDAYVRGADVVGGTSQQNVVAGKPRNPVPAHAGAAARGRGRRRGGDPRPVRAGGAGRRRRDRGAEHAGTEPRVRLRRAQPRHAVVAGRPPTGPGEIAVETSTLHASGLAVGDATTIVIGGEVRPVTVVGEIGHRVRARRCHRRVRRPRDGPGGVRARGHGRVDLGAGRRRASPSSSWWTGSRPSSSGADAHAEVITGDAMRAEAIASVLTLLGFITTFLLVFAGISLFVGAFIIANTFSMWVRQRMREFALLRAVGASPLQVFTSIVLQAAIVGVIGSVLGVAGRARARRGPARCARLGRHAADRPGAARRVHDRRLGARRDARQRARGRPARPSRGAGPAGRGSPRRDHRAGALAAPTRDRRRCPGGRGGRHARGRAARPRRRPRRGDARLRRSRGRDRGARGVADPGARDPAGARGPVHRLAAGRAAGPRQRHAQPASHREHRGCADDRHGARRRRRGDRRDDAGVHQRDRRPARPPPTTSCGRRPGPRARAGDRGRARPARRARRRLVRDRLGARRHGLVRDHRHRPRRDRPQHPHRGGRGVVPRRARGRAGRGAAHDDARRGLGGR